MKNNTKMCINGFLKIFDPVTTEVFFDGTNSIHYENMSVAMVNSLSNRGIGMIYEMSFGSGGTIVDPTGLISYLTPNTIGVNASLYNQTYTKLIDDTTVANVDPVRNKMEVRHISGATYSDILVSCLLANTFNGTIEASLLLASAIDRDIPITTATEQATPFRLALKP